MPLEDRTPEQAFIDDLVRRAVARRHAWNSELADLDRTLRDEKAPPDAVGRPQVNIPLTRAQRRALRARLNESFLGARPFARIRAVRGADSQTDIDWHAATREATDFVEYGYKSREMFNIRQPLRRVLMETVDYGTGAWKVVPDDAGIPKWYFISAWDLLFPEGLGYDVRDLPWLGYVRYVSRAQAEARVDRGLWTRADVDFIYSMSDSELDERSEHVLGSLPVPTSQYQEHKRHAYAEIWYHWFDEDAGEQLKVVDYHLASGTIMRAEVVGDTFDRMPFFVVHFDDQSALSFLGSGLTNDTRELQSVLNAIYNGAIRSLRVALKQIRLIRRDSHLAEVIQEGDDQIEITEDIQAITENPEADLRLVPLGDPTPIGAVLGMTQDIRQMVSDMTGIGPAQLGNVGLTRRSPAFGVASVLEEGSFPIRDATQRIGEVVEEAVLYTLELFAEQGPPELPYRVLGDDGAVLERMFALEPNVRSRYSVEIEVADPAQSREAEQQQRLLRAQFGFSWLERLVSLVGLMSRPQVPDPARRALIAVAEKSEQFMRDVIEASGDVQNVDRLVLRTRDILDDLATVDRVVRSIQDAGVSAETAADQAPVAASAPTPALAPGVGE